MLPIGIISTAYFDYDDYREGIAALKADGFDCTDYQGFMHGDEMLYQMREDERRAYLNDVYQCAVATGVQINQMHALWPPEIDTVQHIDESNEKLRSAVRGASYLHCPHLVVHPYMPRGWASDANPADTFALNVGMLGMLCAYASDHGVRICVENLPFPNVPIARTSEVLRLIERVNAENIGVCLDVGHSHVLHENIGDTVRRIASRLFTLHIHDNHGYTDSHSMPWQGSIRWDEFARALADAKFSGCISLEVDFNHAMPQEIRSDLRKTLARLAAAVACRVKNIG